MFGGFIVCISFRFGRVYLVRGFDFVDIVGCGGICDDERFREWFFRWREEVCYDVFGIVMNLG